MDAFHYFLRIGQDLATLPGLLALAILIVFIVIAWVKRRN